jgi:hypothetical protein
MKNKYLIIFSLLLTFLLGLYSVYFCSALNANFTNSTGSIERALNSIDSTNLINFTIGAMSESISNVQFIITGSTCMDRDKVIIDSNGTNSLLSFFSNISYSPCLGGGDSYTLIVNYANMTGSAIIPNGTRRSFWFNLNSKSMASSMLSVLVNATGNSSGTTNQSNAGTSYSWPFTFRFSGYVKNETGGFQNATNVSLWRFQEGQDGPPTETLVVQSQTGILGNFTLSGISAEGSANYKLKIVLYNQSNPSQALKVGTNLPPFPAEMYYPKIFGLGENIPVYEFMRPPSLNGTTFYLGSAATLNISANNGTDAQRFGYMVMEEGTGFPIESNSNANVTNVQIVVPTNRAYTVMVMRNNNAFVNYPFAVCDGAFMNDTACRTPPRSNSSVRPVISGQVINVNVSMVIYRKSMYGCIGVSGNSTPITNISLILPKMTPWTGFVPPVRADVQDLNLSNTRQLNYSDYRCPGKVAWYNFSVLNSNYFVEFYGRNNTSYSGGEFVGALQNGSFNSENSGENINITMYPLAGIFSTPTFGEVSQGIGTNTTKFTIRIQNSSGSAITQDRPHIEVTLKNSSLFGEITYVVEPTNGSFSLMIPRIVTGKVKVFSNNAPPKERVLNLSQSELNITLINMQAGDGGFKRKNSSGQLELMNISEDSFNIAMNFFRTGGICDSIPIDSTCNLTSTGVRNFNPFLALVAGKVNMQMRLSSGVSIIFFNFDMFSAKQPPMESVMNNQAISGNGSASQTWEFGSFVPADVYDYAVISIPYSDSVINDSAEVRMRIPYLYDESWNVVFNSSRGDTSSNLTSDIDDYLGNSNNRSFNSTGYSGFVNSTGVLCNRTNSTITGSNPAVYCYIDTSNNLMYMRVPHFSGVSPSISASAPATSSSTTTTGSSSGGGGAGGNINKVYTLNDDQLKLAYTQILRVNDKLKFKIDNASYTSTLVNVTSTEAVINLSSVISSSSGGSSGGGGGGGSINLKKTLQVGDEWKIELTNDDLYDVSMKLNSINPISNSTNVTIKAIKELVKKEESITGKVVDSEKNSSETIGNSSSSKLFSSKIIWFIGVGVVIILIIIGYAFYNYYRNQNP